MKIFVQNQVGVDSEACEKNYCRYIVNMSRIIFWA